MGREVPWRRVRSGSANTRMNVARESSEVGDERRRGEKCCRVAQRATRRERRGRLVRKTFHWWSLVSCDRRGIQFRGAEDLAPGDAQRSIRITSLS